MEAQLCGCKVLTFDTGGSKETQLGNLYLCEKRIDDILKCVYIIAEKPFNKVDINFANCDTMSKKYYELFKDCIKAN